MKGDQKLLLPLLIGAITVAVQQKAFVDAQEKSCRVNARGEEVCFDVSSDLNEEEEEYACEDKHRKCAAWADIGECETNKGYMSKNCPWSCNMCANPGEGADVEAPPVYGTAQKFSANDEKTLIVMREMNEYMTTEVFREAKYRNLKGNCLNQHELCAFWAGLGECENNPSYMKINCAPACKTCIELDVNYRCSYTEDEYPDAYVPGDLNAMFEGIANGKWDQYHPVIHSAPADYKRVNETSIVDDSNVQLGGPWVVTFDNFLTDAEADRMIELGYTEGYKRSTDVGGRKFDGTYDKKVSSTRTSENAWCMSKCEKDPTSIELLDRIGNVTNIYASHTENFQILKYEESQRYAQHHDYIGHHDSLPCGPRVLTFFLYLSDVEEGGGTRFNKLNIDVVPKKGRALLWPSVINDQPNRPDYRTHHEALPVIKGTKFAANAWLHLRNYQKAHRAGCTG
uniref:Procollagen-proline 4-dioxygenase n=1 Tax=Leptocylindrus danicus TaxID=163516 RepID=A0A7S2P0I7_9STRA|mmetsp:Transcript_20716/g.30853  ORF Transcript_20716/g.30853 Transcript_20716/m.30853 type:complete len:455 (+) Transcript_20716:45-1409(+)